MSKIIVFKYNPYVGEHNAEIEEMEFDDNATEEEIGEAWTEWLLEKVSECSTWYEKK